jgi:hypothetical protein
MTMDSTYALQLMIRPRPPAVTNVMDGAPNKPHWIGLRVARRACSLTARLDALLRVRRSLRVPCATLQNLVAPDLCTLSLIHSINRNLCRHRRTDTIRLFPPPYLIKLVLCCQICLMSKQLYTGA